jgi:desulfoferrodoxin-like iron-binding protein
MDKGEKSRQEFLLSISLFKEIEARYIESVTRRNLMEEFEFYRCERCGNVVALLVKGGGTLTCCGAAMTKLVAKTADAGSENTSRSLPMKAGSSSRNAAASPTR